MNNMGRFKELDGLRGIAACLVMLFHYTTMANVGPFLLRAGVTGVDLFFLISGFVILLTLEKTVRANDFIVSRVSRLFPSYITMLLLTSLIIYLFDRPGAPSLGEMALNLTMMQPFFRVKYIDSSYWTLTVEMQFYIFMLLVYLSRRLKDIERVGFVTLTGIMVYYIITSRYFPNSKAYIMFRAFCPILSHFQLFFAGIVFYKMKKEGMKPYRHLLLLICILITYFLFDKSGRSHFFIGVVPYMVMICIYFGLFYLFVTGRLTWLNVPLLTGLGAISYCVYLFHQQAGLVLYYHLIDAVGFRPMPAICLLLAFVLAVSTFVTYLIERPMIERIRKRWTLKPTR